MRPRSFVRALLPLSALAAIVATPAAFAQDRSSGTQLTPNSARYLISKDVGNERWAISFNLDDRTVTGNVFKTDGSPASFIFCSITNEVPAANPADTQYTLDCSGAPACTQAPCAPESWTPIASGIPISGSFMLPPGTASTFRGAVEPIFNQRCATGGCHLGPLPAQGLDLSPGNAYRNIFLVLSTQDDDHFLIEPFDPGSSHLYGKVTGEEVGSRMPPIGAPLTQEQLDGVSRWIVEGAANN